MASVDFGGRVTVEIYTQTQTYVHTHTCSFNIYLGSAYRYVRSLRVA